MSDATAAVTLRFQRFAGSVQPIVETAADLAAVCDLPDSSWMATSAPVGALRCDPAFLAYVDHDGNGRIVTDEVREIIDWTLERLGDTDGLEAAADALQLDALADHDAGRLLRASAEHILKNAGCAGQTCLPLSMVRNEQRIRANAAANGDGIISPGCVEDVEVKTLVVDVIVACGGVTDASGVPGVDTPSLDRFLADTRDHLAWLDRARAEPAILPDGDETSGHHAALAAVADKIDAFFDCCRFLRLDARAGAGMGIPAGVLAALQATDTATMERLGREAPLAIPEADAVLDLDAEVNPYWLEELRGFCERILDPRGRPHRLTESDWRSLKARYCAYAGWRAEEAGATVASLPEARLRAHLDGQAVATLRQMIKDDILAGPKVAEVKNLEKLILAQHWLVELANNYVCFSRLYDTRIYSLFQYGTLIIGGRELSFSLRVEDLKRHRQLAAKSMMFVLYVEVAAWHEQPGFTVALPVTAGDAEGLHRHRPCVFRTTDNVLRDAVVVDLIENPISMWEAVKHPFIQLGRFVQGQADKFTTARYAEMEQGLGQEITQLDRTVSSATTATGATPPPPPKAGGSMARDLLLGGSLSFAALASAFAFVTEKLAHISWLHILGMTALALGVIAAILVLPVALIGLLKLRSRSFTPILEASGWAINDRLRLHAGLGDHFTRFARPPVPVRVALAIRRMKRLLVIAGLVAGIAIVILILLSAGQLDWLIRATANP